MHFHQKILFSVTFSYFLTFLPISAGNLHAIDLGLLSGFGKDATATKSVMVSFTQGVDRVLDTIEMADITTEGGVKSFHERYIAECKLLTREFQLPLLEFLASKPNNVSSFWVTNQLFVKDASLELVEAIASFPGVKAVNAEKIFHTMKPIEESQVFEGRQGGNVLGNTSTTRNTEWNVKKIKADQCWSSFIPSRVIVCVIDTGVMSDHEAFAPGQVAGWKDCVNGKSNPYDDNGHGTHVSGTIAGITGTGVAPGATLLCCKSCDGKGACAEADLTACCQWMTEMKPHVVSISWGGPSDTSAAYNSVMAGWKAFNTFSCCAAGNSGPSCSTMSTPADQASAGCSVGSTTSADELSSFSSRGKCKNGLVGPTVSAPGSSITSAWPTSKTSYKTISGTSMATPHVSGMVALLRSSNPSITFDQIRAAIIKSCTTTGLVDPKQTCGGTSFSQAPNNMYGYGRIDCVKALQTVSKLNAQGEFIE